MLVGGENPVPVESEKISMFVIGQFTASVEENGGITNSGSASVLMSQMKLFVRLASYVIVF
jgi:hypothetical protein